MSLRLLDGLAPTHWSGVNWGSDQAEHIAHWYPGPELGGVCAHDVITLGPLTAASTTVPLAISGDGWYWDGDAAGHVNLGLVDDWYADIGTGYTIAFRMRYSEDTATLRRIMGSVETDTSDFVLVNLNRANNGSIELLQRDDSANQEQYYTASGGFQDGAWHDVVIGSDADGGGYAIWVDGLSRALTTASTDTLSDPYTMVRGMFACARNLSGSANGQTDVSLRDIRFYRRNVSSVLGPAYHDPRTRYDLWYRPSARVYSFAAAAAAAGLSVNLAGSGGLAGTGGLAGVGGGLAG